MHRDMQPGRHIAGKAACRGCDRLRRSRAVQRGPARLPWQPQRRPRHRRRAWPCAVRLRPLWNAEALPDAAGREDIARADLLFEAMRDLACELLIIRANTSEAALDDPGRAAADLAALAGRAAGQGLRIGYEALPWARHVVHWRQAWDIV